jgi:flagellar L-ring protein precursor FlgH
MTLSVVRAAVVALAAWFLLVGSAAGTTIVPSDGSLYADHAAKRVGDILTVLIVESTSASKTASTETKTSTANDGSGLGHFDFFDLWNLQAENASQGEGTTRRRGDLQARITVRVTEIDANGLLVLEGTRSVLVNGEEERIVLRGSVRPADVQADNTVLSTFLADATIEYTGEGVLTSAEKPGLITRLMNWIF